MPLPHGTVGAACKAADMSSNIRRNGVTRADVRLLHPDYPTACPDLNREYERRALRLREILTGRS